MNLKRLLAYVTVFAATCAAKGQDSSAISTPEDTVLSQIVYDTYPVSMSASLVDLIDRQVKINAADKRTSGFRIQLYYGNREEAINRKSEFIETYQFKRVYVDYEQPYFKTKIGDFKTSLEAEKVLRSLGEYCKGCFVVADQIQFPSLNDERPIVPE